jgi:hypothetical protein
MNLLFATASTWAGLPLIVKILIWIFGILLGGGILVALAMGGFFLFVYLTYGQEGKGG